jgi:hypothetical protein
VGEGKGFVYRFPNRDFQLGFSRVPEIGETVTAKGRRSTVVEVRRGTDNHALVSLASIDKPGEAEVPLDPG